jgi:hypothetical protein
MDANDTYLVISSVTINTNTQSKDACKLIANIIPKSVAIPLPPLKPAKTGNKWPITAAIPKRQFVISKSYGMIGAGCRNTYNIGQVSGCPSFKISSSITGMPAFLPNTLKYL